MPWLTPDSVPVERAWMCIQHPDSPEVRQAIAGALLELTRSSNWEPVGGMSPEDIAAVFLDVFFSKRRCAPMQAGDIVLSGSWTPGDGRLLCDGSTFDPAEYPDLYAAIGENFGTSGGFPLLPDMRNAFPRGAGAEGASGQTQVGDTGGNDQITQTVFQMPSHTHNIPQMITAPLQAGGGFGWAPLAGSWVTSSQGGGQPMDIRPRFVGLAYYIVARV